MKRATAPVLCLMDALDHMPPAAEAARYLLESLGFRQVELLYVSPFPEERLKSVPAEKKYPAREIIEVMKSARIFGKRRMSVAYIMIRDLNDTRRHLEGLKELLLNTGIRVNLLPYHSVPGDGNISSSPETMNHFKHELVISGISASIRKSSGADIFAACGLLASGLK